LWDTVGAKKDYRHNGNDYSSLYFNLNFEYTLKQFYPKIQELIELIYGPEDEKMKEWYKCFENNNVNWIAIGYDYKNRLSLTIYFVYDKYIRNTFDMNQVIKFTKLFKSLK